MPSDRYKNDRLAMARIERDRKMRKMALCRCEWPLTVLRNGDGHAEDCPAHTALSGSSELPEVEAGRDAPASPIATPVILCRSCGGDGSWLTPENDGTGAQCGTCRVWNIDFCPDCGDEFDAPCIAHFYTEHY